MLATVTFFMLQRTNEGITKIGKWSLLRITNKVFYENLTEQNPKLRVKVKKVKAVCMVMELLFSKHCQENSTFLGRFQVTYEFLT